MKPTVLVIVQGRNNVTETEYFKKLKNHYRLSSLTIKGESDCSPEKIVKATERLRDRDRNAPFDKVFFVVDVDDSTPDQFAQGFKAARNATNRETSCNFIVSNEAFDAWLLAHFENLCGRSLSRETVASKLRKDGILFGTSGKNVKEDFPVHQHVEARKNIGELEMDAVGRASATAIPVLIDELLKLR